MLAFAALVIAATLPSLEPDPSAQVLTVQVTDGTGAFLPGAVVEVIRKSGKTLASASTDRNGVVKIEGLQGGVPLEVRVSFPGFAGLCFDEVLLAGSLSLHAELTEELIERVCVDCGWSGKLIDLDSVGHRPVLSGEFLADLPGGRSGAEITPLPPRPKCRRAGDPQGGGKRARSSLHPGSD